MMKQSPSSGGTISQAILDQYHATPVAIDLRSGVMADVKFAGLPFRLSTGFCNHTDIEIALFYTGREPSDALSAISVCSVCGVRSTIASMLTTPAQTRVSNARIDAIFAPVVARFRSDTRVQWGMPARPAYRGLLPVESVAR
jgi:hypothetical protein